MLYRCVSTPLRILVYGPAGAGSVYLVPSEGDRSLMAFSVVVFAAIQYHHQLINNLVPMYVIVDVMMCPSKH